MRCLFVCFLCVLLPLPADLLRLEELTGQWMALRLERSREAQVWQEEQSRLRLELSLLDEAEQRLREELAALREDASDTETEQAGLIEELRERQGQLTPLLPALRRAEAGARAHADGLPPSLRQRVEAERTALDTAGAEPLPRLRAVITLLNQLLHTQTEIHVRSEMLTLEGQRREMDVLWIGEAAGYAVSADNRLAARLRHGSEETSWEPFPGAASRIREAIAIVNREKPPVLLRLPVEGAE